MKKDGSVLIFLLFIQFSTVNPTQIAVAYEELQERLHGMEQC